MSARVLLVDDDRELTDLLRDYLVADGFDVHLAHDGQAGAAAALDGGVDIVVLDVMMPGSDGIEALSRIRAHSTVPVLMLTARGDDTVASGLAFGSVSSYQQRNSDTYDADLIGASGSTLATYSLALGQVQSTVYFYGSSGALGELKVTDEAATVTKDKFIVHTLRLAPNLTAMDLYVTAADASLDSLSPTVYATSTGALSSASSEADAGSYRVRLTVSGTRNVVFDSTMSFAAGSTNTLVLYSLGSAQLPTVLWTRPEDGTAVVVPNTLARLRVVQGTPDVASSRIRIDDANVFQSVPYAAVTNYITVNAGARALAFQNEASSETFMQTTTTLVAGHDYTAYAAGTVANAHALLFDENSTDITSSTKARARFVNATADQTAIDVVVNYQPLVSQLASGARSTVQSLDATTYPLAFYGSNSASLLASLTTDTLDGGGDYAFALIGSVGNYQAIAYRTN